MKTYWKSEAPYNPYYIKYSIDYKDRSEIHEFWTDEEEHFKDKKGFIERHYNYRLLEVALPLTNLS
jgi:hypothetical protein